MRFSQGKSVQRSGNRFTDFKEIDYFKQIFKLNSDLFLKELIPMVISKGTIKNLNHSLYLYIPQEDIEQCPANKLIDQSITQLKHKAMLIRISKHLDVVLREIFMLNIPVLQNFKTQDRFLFLNECQSKSLPFGRILVRKGDHINGIYYVVRGQLRIIGENQQKQKLMSTGNFLCLDDLSTSETLSSQTIISNTNKCLLLFIRMELLRDVMSEEVCLKDLFIDYHRKNHHKYETKGIKSLIQSKQAKMKKKLSFQSMNFTDFTKRSKEFKETTSRKDQNFNKYLETKKFILKLHETIQNSSCKLVDTKQQPSKCLKAKEKVKQSRPRHNLFRDILMRRLKTSQKKME